MTQRSAFGYMRIEHNTPSATLQILRRQIESCVAKHGFALSQIFVESGNTADSAFAALMDALCASGVTTVVVPSMRHLARLESVGIAMKRHIEQETGASVLIAAIDCNEPRSVG